MLSRSVLIDIAIVDNKVRGTAHLNATSIIIIGQQTICFGTGLHDVTVDIICVNINSVFA